MKKIVSPILCMSLMNMVLVGQSLSGERNLEYRIRLTLDPTESERVLSILAERKSGKDVTDSDWQRLFATEPYRRLKQREEAIGKMYGDPKRAFADEDFKKFVLSDGLLDRDQELRLTLDKWEKIDLRASAQRILTYLPADAFIRARVYPVIKPRTNSFVFEPGTNPAIFLYLDPKEPAAKFENTVAHELHHIGLASLGPVYEKRIAALPERAQEAADWMGAFGEGLAMLAAGGGPDIDPHASSSAEERARWEHDLANFNADLQSVNTFFEDTLSGKLADKDAVSTKASSFFGVQGPWYTVGYKMAVMVEKRFGRPKLIETMTDFRQLLVLYNQAAREHNRAGGDQLPLWSDDMLREAGAIGT
ncbi:MAG TPA: DUF5700 domain-containing putative Zn-dependent protease [Blastocatellia bacterium]